MKTITEFSALTIRQAATLKATLTAEGVAPEAEAERFSSELSLTGDRLARLIEALGAVGDKADRVRLVRVFAGDAEVKGATKIGEFNYVVDLQPSLQAGGGRDKGRGGKRGGPGGDRGKPGGGGPVGLGGGKGPGGRDRSPYEKEPPRGEVPSAGPGWMVTRAPAAPGDRRGPGGGRKGGRPGQRPGNRPGAPGADRGRPGGGRGPGGNRPGGPGGPPGQRAGGPSGEHRGPGGNRPPGPGGNRPPGGPGGNRPPGDRPQGPRPGRPHHHGRGGRPSLPPPIVETKARPPIDTAAPPVAPVATPAPSTPPDEPK